MIAFMNEKLIKVLSANLLILLLLLVTTDFIFGDWFTKNNYKNLSLPNKEINLLQILKKT
jgi:hypothetical protein